ncbi:MULTISPECIES: DUF3422 domain-containing protein [Rhizobium/Agrobacterium group]|uniref:DUF3422 domain-containing protein n=2 Tax=Rhizobium/Agrobacterium group TaxID=227290 RepID=A0A9X3KQW2_9HYPH|nr:MULTISPECIES: DUF3422 domain-containing protein [Rhizobium/Agrobacterium group]MBO9126230.1 DUF3422 domain-containing protein [Rhizobium sp. 16-488-2b]MBO9176814.1 DUF3422 domain-containing protein [Rhizobium sp. 16-488-2a]MBO9197383.1 DUF3422 domain-containing protein [Rhizobium sp. 16-449-1b]MCZ7466756.1 DUF3422 domain-containing protein [Rhizobium rhizogenes]MCZ7939214.1 DUF3422 domain-containing protein [Agrobacterium salinitolerans]
MPFATEHPLRRNLHEELHARPSLYFDGDTDVWHVAIVECDRSCLTSFTSGLEDVSTTGQGCHGIGRLENGRLKWEAHTEFVTLTYLIPADSDYANKLPSIFDYIERLGGEVISATRVIVRDENDSKPHSQPADDFVASKVGGGDAEVCSNFQLSESGFVELHFFNRKLNAYRTGRMVRRLLEIETYRMMALLAVPVTRETLEKIVQFDARVDHLITHMQTSAKVDKALLSDVTKLSSDVLNYSSNARTRFGATKAYADIVNRRLVEIREERVEQRQRISTFIERRFLPAVQSASAAERRLAELGERVALAGDLLRTTVQVQLEDQNASLLASVEERTRVQVHIQQAVEGFSVIAIAYYVIGLIKICLEAAVELGLNPHLAKLSILFALPMIVLLLSGIIRRVRRAITAKTPS